MTAASCLELGQENATKQAMNDAQRRIEAAIRAEHLRVADMLRDDPQRVIDYARGRMDKWGWSEALRSGRPAPYMREWDALLSGPPDALAAVLTASLSDERAIWLRSSSPFAGIIPPRERWAIRERARQEGAHEAR